MRKIFLEFFLKSGIFFRGNRDFGQNWLATMLAPSVGLYIDSTIETIDDLGLSIISMVFLNYR